MSARTGAVGAVLLLSAASALVPACSDDAAAPSPTWQTCQAGDQAFVRRAMFAVSGRQPWGQAEVNVYEDVLRGLRDVGFSERDARIAVLGVLARDESYLLRWADFFLDTLRVQRRVTSSYFGNLGKNCFGPVGAPEGPELAEWIRDASPTESAAQFPSFTMARLVTSSIVLDDLSPLYRAGLFQLLAAPLQGANVDALTLERARRLSFGETFGDVYLNRDLVCMRCHNSELSTTFHPDPVVNRAWPVPGLFERALYGTSAPEGDPLTYHSVFRFTGVADGTKGPWGWHPTHCGVFQVPTEDDPLGIDAVFGSIHSTPEKPTVGKRASVWNLEYSLRRGIDTVAEAGSVARDPADPSILADEDQAFAYVVAMSVAEDVWEETMGSPLTIANHFPRTAEQRDVLGQLADRFSVTHFSLRTLLGEIVAHPAFNLADATSACWTTGYPLPRFFNPWTTDGDAKGNSIGDAVHPRSIRPLTRALHTAMEWPAMQDFPDEKDGELQTAIGFSLGPTESGFRGLHSEARLVWEREYARCGVSTPDFLDDLIDRGVASGATAGDVVIALKDRLVGEPWLDPEETKHIEAILGGAITATDLDALEPGLRLVCGAVVSSPQFMLGGIVPPHTRTVPRLSHPKRGYDSVCKTVALRAQGLGGSWAVACSPGSLSVSIK